MRVELRRLPLPDTAAPADAAVTRATASTAREHVNGHLIPCILLRGQSDSAFMIETRPMRRSRGARCGLGVPPPSSQPESNPGKAHS